MKILAIGCSFTYGAELPDCDLDTLYIKKRPSNLAYPSLLGKLYDAEVVNLSVPGGSNGRIFRLAIDAVALDHYDLVICGWTDHCRADFRYNNNDLPTTALSTWATDQFPWLSHYYKYHHEYNHSWQVWLTQLLALQSHFKHIGQKYIFLSMHEPLYGGAKLFKHVSDQIDPTYYIGWPKFGMTTFMGDCPKGPGGHPLELGHQRIAERIDEHIRNLSWFPRCSSHSN